MLPAFSSLRPETKREALAHLAGLSGAAVVAGGTDLLVRMKKGEHHDQVVDITGVRELKGISAKDGSLHLGPCTTHAEISRDGAVVQAARSLAVASGAVGSPQIRTMGTIGGNIVNASPAADTIPPLLIHDARVTVESERGAREVPFEKFIVAPYKTIIERNEIVSSIVLVPLQGYTEGYRRVAKRATLAISRLSLAWALKKENGCFREVRLAIGSCTPMPLRLRKAEAFLKGQKTDTKTIAEAVRIVLEEIREISGERPSFVYKLPVVRDLLSGILEGA
jgi:CO/xanthine dehydrogenase FAD-binding subunit